MYNHSISGKAMACVLVALVGVSACSGKEERIAKHMERAHSHVAAADYEKARVEFKNVLQIDPKNIDALYGQAEVHEKLEKWREAAGLYQGVVDLDRSRLDAKERLARLIFLGGGADKAAELADEVLMVRPDSVVALTVKGGALAQKGDLAAASRAAKDALSVSPGHVDAIMLLASLLTQQKEYVEALHVLEAGLAHNADHAGIVTLMAQINADLGQQDRAAELFQRLVTTKPDDMAYRRQLASYYVRLKKLDMAKQVLREGVQRLPDQIEPKLMLVDFILKTEGAEPALSELQIFIASQGESTELRLALARVYEVAGKKDDAKHELLALIDAHGGKPDALKARLHLARLVAGESGREEARRLVNEVLKENPRDNEGLLLRGKLALLENDLPSAIGDLRAVLRDQPNSVEVLSLLGRAHLAAKEVELAKEHLDKAIELSPSPAPLRFEIGQLYFQAGLTAEALQEFERVSLEPTADAPVFEALFRSQMAKKDFSAARATAQRVRQMQPKQGFGEFLAGQVDVAEGKYPSAVTRFKAALAKTPGSAEALSALVKTRLAQQQGKEALADVQAILKAEPKDYVAQNILGELYLVLNNPKEAALVFHKALKLNASIATTYRNLATANLKLQDREGAISVLEEGIQTLKRPEMLVVDLAVLYEGTGHVDDAVRVYGSALEKEPKSKVLANNLAMLLVSHRKDAASLHRASQLMGALAGSDNPSYLDTMGWVHYSRGDLDKALPLLQQAARAAPGQSLVQYHLGMAQYKKGDYASAKLSLRSALDGKASFPGRDEASVIMQQIAAGG